MKKIQQQQPRTLKDRAIQWLVWTNRISRSHASTINWNLISDNHVLGTYYSEVSGRYRYHLQIEAWIVSGDFTPTFTILHDN